MWKNFCAIFCPCQITLNEQQTVKLQKSKSTLQNKHGHWRQKIISTWQIKYGSWQQKRQIWFFGQQVKSQNSGAIGKDNNLVHRLKSFDWVDGGPTASNSCYHHQIRVCFEAVHCTYRIGSCTRTLQLAKLGHHPSFYFKCAVVVAAVKQTCKP